MEQTRFLSVGIDIGTTTTQLIFSSLLVVNAAGPTQAPRYTIAEREVIYRGPVVFTPKKRGAGNAEEVIDEAALAALVRSWYADAGIAGGDVQSGAVIITGESLKTANAKEAVLRLSDSLGDFVVATAGPHLESVIAGKGSGAAALSRENKSTVLNIDIGGGTSNYAVFRAGETVDTACLNVGGRLIETDAAGQVLRVHEPARHILADVFGRADYLPDAHELPRVAERMADLIFDACRGMSCPLGKQLLQTLPLQSGQHFDAVMVSGGVGACCRDMPGDPFMYGDIGPLLAKAILRHPGLGALPLTAPEGAVRATVIGAGAWSLSLSGSTVWADAQCFPLRNVPVASIPLYSAALPADLAAFIHERLRHLDINPAQEIFAVAFGCLPETYATVTYLAEGLARFWNALPSAGPILVILQNDIGKALGMELRPALPGRPLVVVDEVRAGDGDWLDLGTPPKGAGFIPLVIKSLAFGGEKN